MRGILIALLMIGGSGLRAQQSTDSESALHLSVQTGHAGAVVSLSFNGDGTRLASGGADNQTILWDLKNGRQIMRFDAGSPVRQVALHPDKPFLAVVNEGGILNVWNVTTRELVLEKSRVGYTVQFTSAGKYLDAGASRFDVNGFAASGTNGAPAAATSFDASAQAGFAWGTSEETVVKVQGSSLKFLKGRADAVTFSPDGQRVYAANRAGVLRAFDVESGKKAFELTSYRKAAGFTSIAASEKLLAATLSDGAIQFYNPADGRVIDYLIAFEGGAMSSKFSPDGNIIAVGSQFGEIFLWDASTRELVFLLSGITRKINVMKFSKDGNQLFMGFDDGTFKYWDYRPGGKTLSARIEKRLIRSSDRWQFVVNQEPYSMSGQEIRFIASLEQRMADPSNPRPRKVYDYDVSWNLRTNVLTTKEYKSKALLKSEANTVTTSAYYRRDGEYRKNRRIINNIWPVSYMVASGGIDGGDVLPFYLILGGVYNLVTLYPRDQSYTQTSGPGVKVIDQDFTTRKRLASHRMASNGSAVAASIESHDFVRLWPTAAATAYSLYDPSRYTLKDTRPNRYEWKLFNLKTGRETAAVSAGEPITEYGFSDGGRYAWVLKGTSLQVYETATGKLQLERKSRHAAAFSTDASRLLWVNSGNRLMSTALSGGDEIQMDPAGETRITAIEMRGDGKVIAAAGSDGLVQLFNAETGARMLTMASIGAEDFMYITPANEYYVSKGALRGVGYEIQGSLYPFDQFDVRFNRPDRIMQVLGNQDEVLRQYYYAAWKKRLEKLNIVDTAAALNLAELPQLTLHGSSQLRATQENYKLTVDAIDYRVPLTRLMVWVNTVPEFGTRGMAVSDSRPGELFTRDLSIRLNPGVNIIEVRVDNEAGRSSLKQTLRVNYVPESKPDVNLYMLAIGSSKFQDATQNLNFAAKDAGDLVQAMKGAGGFKNVYEKTILNEDVSREAILASRDFIARAGVNDVVMVFFAGHGMLDDRNNLFLSTYGVDFSNPAAGGTPYSELEGLLDGIPSRQKILFIDACHSGEFDADAEQARTEETALKGGKVLQRGLTAKKSAGKRKAGFGKAFELSKLLFADLRESNGAVVISAAGGAEFAFEGGTFKNGVFTYSLINGMKNRKADLNKDGAIAASELARFLSTEVSRLTNGRQTPTSRVENLQHDFHVY